MKCKYLEHQVMIRPDGEFRMCCISKEKTNKEILLFSKIDKIIPDKLKINPKR